MRFTQQRGNVALRPAATVMVLCTEFGKLVLSALLEHTHCFGIGSAQPLSQVAKSALAVKELARVSVPAFLYTIQNNLIFVSPPQSAHDTRICSRPLRATFAPFRLLSLTNAPFFTFHEDS